MAKLDQGKGRRDCSEHERSDLHSLPKTNLCEAPKMAFSGGAVVVAWRPMNSIEKRDCRDEQPSWLQDALDLAKDSSVVPDMLQSIETHHEVAASAQQRDAPREIGHDRGTHPRIQVHRIQSARHTQPGLVSTAGATTCVDAHTVQLDGLDPFLLEKA
jgi:hypothetical protein